MAHKANATNSPTTASFQVDPRLAAILGESYSSSEKALCELIHNAWDAEATEVRVTLPGVLTEDPIVIDDNGSGMKENEVRFEYLNIACPRFTRKGERTPNKLRVVKGRRGIGKFSGLILAETMQLATRAFGAETTVTISKKALFAAGKDLEKVPLPIEVTTVGKSEHGTRITLKNLNRKLNFPMEDKLRELLAYDYGRDEDFVILLNGEKVFRFNIQGATFKKEIELPDGQKATVTYTIADKPIPGRKAGIIWRMNGKTVGGPSLCGLEDNEMLSDRLKRRFVGEIELPENSAELTALGGDIIQSDKVFNQVAEEVRGDVLKSLTEIHTQEVNLAKGNWTQMMNRRLENVPEHRRAICEERLTKLVARSYQEGEKDERIEVLVGLVLEAMERDEYWTVCRGIQEAERVDVFHFAEALEKFGLCDLAFIAQQAKRRTEFLQYLERLALEPKTTERQMHIALQHNLWVFGPQYGLMSSNQQLKTIIQEYADTQYKGEDATKRPDLLLAGDVANRHLLIEFKRPVDPVGRDAERQAKEYADTLTGRLGIHLEILIVGGKVDANMQVEYHGQKTRFAAYLLLIATARTQHEWLLKELKQYDSGKKDSPR